MISASVILALSDPRSGARPEKVHGADLSRSRRQILTSSLLEVYDRLAFTQLPLVVRQGTFDRLMPATLMSQIDVDEWNR